MPVNLNTSGSIVVSDDSDTTDTDYEPEAKRCKVVVEDTAESKAGELGIGGSSGSGDSDKPKKDVIVQGSSEGLGESSQTDSNSTDSRNSAPSQPNSVDNDSSNVSSSQTQRLVEAVEPEDLLHRFVRVRRRVDQSIRVGVGERLSSLEGRNRLSEHSQRQHLGEEEEEGEDEENVLNQQQGGSGSPSPTSVSVSSGSGGYLTDPVASDEIPSDLEYSPPCPTPPPLPEPPQQIQRHNRQRRNAIFERRDPPPVTAQQIEDNVFYHNELEVASVSDINENPIEDVNSTSGTEHDSVSGSLNITVQASPDHSDNNFADSEAMKSDIDSDATHNSSVRSKGLNSSDSEISEKDKWFCSQCHAKTPPYFRYCLRCFKIRRNWLPKRPPSRRLKRRKAAERRSTVANTSRTTISSDSEGEDVVDGRLRGAIGNSQTQNDQFLSLEPNLALRTSPSSEVQPVLPSVQPIDLNEGFLVDDNNPSLNRLNSNTRPGNVTLLEIFSPPQSQSESQVLQAEGGSSQPLINSEEATTAVDSSPPLTVSSQSTTTSTQSQSTTSSSSSQSLPSQFSQTSSQSQSSDFLSPPQAPHPKVRSGATSTVAGQSVCNICYARAKDAAFVQNRVAHQYCCYPCADKILKRDGKCPICRERVFRVVKVIVV